MRKADLPNCPRWLSDARTEDEDVEWYTDSSSWIVWHDGTWLGGDWRDGTWLGGDWRGGDWYGGTWRDGTWRDGTWHGGTWHGGDWRGGIWRGGASAIRCKWSVRSETDGRISIGCKTKTRKAWNAWFAGKQAYSTERDTWGFASIYGAFKAHCAWVDTVTAFTKRAAKKKAKP